MAVQPGREGLVPITSCSRTGACCSSFRRRSGLACRAFVLGGRGDVNSRSIGIEIANPGHPRRPAALSRGADRKRDRALPDIVRRWSRSAPTGSRPFRRRARPQGRSGRAVSWGALLCAPASAIGSSPSPIEEGRSYGAAIRACRSGAAGACSPIYGYGMRISGVFDTDTEKVVAAFQRHFRPARIDGVADPSTIGDAAQPDRHPAAGCRMTKS